MKIGTHGLRSRIALTFLGWSALAAANSGLEQTTANAHLDEEVGADDCPGYQLEVSEHLQEHGEELAGKTSAADVDEGPPRSPGRFPGMGYVSPSFESTFGYVRMLFLDHGDVYVDRRERDPERGDWHRSREEFDVSYQPRAVSPRTSHDFFVLGFSESSKSWFIERIELSRTAGSYRVERAAAPEGVGTPYTSPPTVVSITGEQGFVPPAERSSLKPRRRIVWVGNTEQLVQPTEFVADPDGRFALAYDEGLRSIVRITFGADSPYEVLYTAEEIAGLELMMDLRVHESSALGRVYLISLLRIAPRRKVLLVDLDNDAEFDTVLTMTQEEFDSPEVAGSFYRNFRTFE